MGDIIHGPGGSVSRSEMTKRATLGGFSIASGVALLVVNGLAAAPIIGPLLGGGLIIAGLLGLRKNKDKKDRLSSIILTGAGGVVLGIGLGLPLIGGLASTLLSLSGFGLIGFGAWKLITYFRGLKRLKQG